MVLPIKEKMKRKCVKMGPMDNIIYSQKKRKRTSIKMNDLDYIKYSKNIQFHSTWDDYNMTFRNWTRRVYSDIITPKLQLNIQNRCHIKLNLTTRNLLFMKYCQYKPFRKKECVLCHTVLHLSRFMCEFEYNTHQLICPECAKYESIVPRSGNRTQFRRLLNREFGKEMRKCYCCSQKKINAEKFHAGHVYSHKNGGSSHISNMRPICDDCNNDMKDTNMLEFMRKKNYPNWKILQKELEEDGYLI